MRYVFPFLIVCILLAGASPLFAMAVGGGGGGLGGGSGGFGGGGGIGRAGGGGKAATCAPAWVSMTAALDRKTGIAPGIVLVFVKNPDTSSLWTEAMLKDETFKRVRHVCIEAEKDEALVAKHGITVFPSLVYCDGYGNPLLTQARPSRTEIKSGHDGLAERITNQQAALRAQLAAINQQQPGRADAVLQRIAALAGPIADEARGMLAKRQPDGKLPTP